ncbi:hypothetical protein ACROYT_G037488 [Oculina patagonica]
MLKGGMRFWGVLDDVMSLREGNAWVLKNAECNNTRRRFDSEKRLKTQVILLNYFRERDTSKALLLREKLNWSRKGHKE